MAGYERVWVKDGVGRFPDRFRFTIAGEVQHSSAVSAVLQVPTAAER
jgi:hypothetical protein